MDSLNLLLGNANALLSDAFRVKSHIELDNIRNHVKSLRAKVNAISRRAPSVDEVRDRIYRKLGMIEMCMVENERKLGERHDSIPYEAGELSPLLMQHLLTNAQT